MVGDNHLTGYVRCIIATDEHCYLSSATDYDTLIMAKMNMTSLDVLTDEVFGKEGTPKRDAMENQLKEEVNAYFVGETFRTPVGGKAKK